MYVLYGDIDGFRAIESPATTVPLDILVTPARPDVVFVHNDNVILKTKKYEVLVSDLEHRGYSTSFLALEIGALGHYSTKTISLFYRLFPMITKSVIKSFLDQTAELAIAASYKLFMSRREPSWCSPLPLLNHNNFFIPVDLLYSHALAKPTLSCIIIVGTLLS